MCWVVMKCTVNVMRTVLEYQSHSNGTMGPGQRATGAYCVTDLIGATRAVAIWKHLIAGAAGAAVAK